MKDCQRRSEELALLLKQCSEGVFESAHGFIRKL